MHCFIVVADLRPKHCCAEVVASNTSFSPLRACYKLSAEANETVLSGTGLIHRFA